MSTMVCNTCSDAFERPRHGKRKMCPTCWGGCSVAGCEAPRTSTAGYCNAHNLQVHTGRPVGPVNGRDPRTCAMCGDNWLPARQSRRTDVCPACRRCSVEGCIAPPTGGQGWCKMHYKRHQSQGLDPHAPVSLICSWCDASFTIPAHESLAGRKAKGCLCDSCRTLRKSGVVNRRHQNGATPPQAAALLAAQDGKCAVCGSAERLCVDHDHYSGKPRGILCQSCNAALGMLQEDVNRIVLLATYVIAHLPRE